MYQGSDQRCFPAPSIRGRDSCRVPSIGEYPASRIMKIAWVLLGYTYTPYADKSRPGSKNPNLTLVHLRKVDRNGWDMNFVDACPEVCFYIFHFRWPHARTKMRFQVSGVCPAAGRRSGQFDRNGDIDLRRLMRARKELGPMCYCCPPHRKRNHRHVSEMKFLIRSNWSLRRPEAALTPRSGCWAGATPLNEVFDVPKEEIDDSFCD